jgi:hypothetical protein
MARPRSRRFEVLLFLGIVAALIPVIVLGSLALRSSQVAPQDAPAAQSGANQEAQICASCWGDGSPDPTVPGQAVMEDGVQVVKVGLVNGYYEPNEFTVEAGIPVTVVFTGRAEGCLAEPEFYELGVKGDMSGGIATLALGPLKPGTYSFTCSMGVNEGTITVR